MKSYLRSAALCSAIVFLVTVLWIGTINIRLQTLKSEYAEKFSVGNLVALTVRSFVDGFTLGVSSGGDMFAEDTKLDVWAKQMRDRESWLREEYSIANTLRILSFIIFLGSASVLYLQHRKSIKG